MSQRKSNQRKPKPVQYRRKRQGRTNYAKRLKYLLSRKARVVVRFTNRKVIAQLVEFAREGDKVIVGVDSSSLKKKGWALSGKNLPAAYLTGLFLGRKAREKNYQEAVLDTGFRSVLKKSRIYAFLKGVTDAGLHLPHSQEGIFPSQERIEGKHLKNKARAEEIAAQFEKARKEIMEGITKVNK